MNYYYHGIKATPHPLSQLHYIFLYVLCFNLYVTIYLYIPNFMKPTLHNCINEYVWHIFFCKNKFFKKHTAHERSDFMIVVVC